MIFGEPYEDSIRTFRPFGPRVVVTALASVSTPFSNEALASTPNLRSWILSASRYSPADLSFTLCAYRCCCKFTAMGIALALCIEPKNGELLRADPLDLDKSARCMLRELEDQ